MERKLFKNSKEVEAVVNYLLPCIVEVYRRHTGLATIFVRGRVAQWLAHAIVCRIVAGSIPGDIK